MIVSQCDFPKISCLMVTNDGRFEYLKRSYASFNDQTYPNKNLIILTDGSQGYKNDIAKLVDGQSNVQLVFLNNKYSLGALRNISIKICDGDFFVQWDDDDFNMPDRLAVQYAAMRKNSCKISYFCDQLHYYFASKCVYWNHWLNYHSGYSVKYALIPGTIMAKRDGFKYRYPSSGHFCQAGEDTILSNAICDDDKDQIFLIKDMGYLYMYSYHGNNVWDIQHHENLSKNRSLSVEQILKQRAKIEMALDYFNLSNHVKVMARDGMAFNYSNELSQN